MKKIFGIIFLMVVLFRGVCYAARAYNCGPYEPEISCVYEKSASMFAKHLDDDIVQAGENEKKLLILLDAIKSSDQKDDIHKAIVLIQETNKLCEFYANNDYLLRYRRYDAYRASNTAYEGIRQNVASMMLRVAAMFVRIGEKDRAKQAYRMIIEGFDYPAYRSYVKKAEFGLDDLKEAK